MVKKSKSLPLFDERFVNYGFNKITWLHHLIRRGYYFGVLSRCFVMDMPHPEYVCGSDYHHHHHHHIDQSFDNSM